MAILDMEVWKVEALSMPPAICPLHDIMAVTTFTGYCCLGNNQQEHMASYACFPLPSSRFPCLYMNTCNHTLKKTVFILCA